MMTEEKMKALRNLKTAKGQIEGIIKMIEEDRYCIDVSTQITACQGLLKKANLHILNGHLNHCMMDAIENQEHTEEKVNEIKMILEKILK